MRHLNFGQLGWQDSSVLKKHNRCSRRHPYHDSRSHDNRNSSNNCSSNPTSATTGTADATQQHIRCGNRNRIDTASLETMAAVKQHEQRQAAVCATDAVRAPE